MQNIVLENPYLRATVSSLGGELISLVRKSDEKEYIWQGDSLFWEDHAPNLFPVCGRLCGGVHMYQGQRYHMPLHGFLRQRNLEISRTHCDFVTFVLDADAETKMYYPYDFHLELTQALEGHRFVTKYRVTCLGKEMYFSWGGHPGFCMPVEKGCDYEDYSVVFAEKCEPKQLSITTDGFVGPRIADFPLEGGRRLPLRRALFAVEGVFLREAARELSICRDGIPLITVRYPDCPTLGLWTSNGGTAPFLCVEPWAGTPDPAGFACTLDKKPDMLYLSENRTYTGGFEIEIHEN